MSIGFARRFVRAAANAKCQMPNAKRCKMSQIGSRISNAELRERLERQAREIKETALTLIEDRGPSNAREWAVHCATRDTSGFWPKVLLEIDRQSAAKIFAIARARRAEARGQ
jgi:hypothetical protein